jgi:predicted acyltransferase
VFGTNAIAAYTLAEIVAILLVRINVYAGSHYLNLHTYLYRSLFGGIYPQELGSLVYAIIFVCLCWLAIYWMYRKRIFLKV